jgi:hypothetical protein
MHGTTAGTGEPGPERGRARARLQADLDALARLDETRPSARERLERKLGRELAQRLVYGLSSSAGRLREMRAA